MTKMINARRGDKDLPFATDEECFEMRNRLIENGKIVPGSQEQAQESSSRTHLSMSRRQLVSGGYLHPIERLPDGGFTFCATIPDPQRHRGSEEGEYSCRPIGSHGEYLRRRQAYFRILQEILHARRELRLVLGQKRSTDPEWYF